MVDGIETITVERGRELYSPIKFHTFEVGRLEITLKIRNGETLLQAAERGYVELEMIAAKEFRRKAKVYLDNVKKLSEYVESRKG